MKIKNIILLVCLGIGLILGGCGEKNNQDEQVINRKKITANQAREIMYERITNGKIVEFGYREDIGVPKYIGKIIKVGKEYRIDVDAKTGNIVSYDTERLEKDEKIYEGDIISETRAKEAILNKSGGGQIIGFKYDGYDSIPIYEGIVIKNEEKMAVLLDARDGKVIGFEKEKIKK